MTVGTGTISFPTSSRIRVVYTDSDGVPHTFDGTVSPDVSPSFKASNSKITTGDPPYGKQSYQGILGGADNSTITLTFSDKTTSAAGTLNNEQSPSIVISGSGNWTT